MSKPIQQLPRWAQIVVRLIALPLAAGLHLIPHVIGYFQAVHRFVLYGGEFITYEKNDPATISDIYQSIRDKQVMGERERVKELRKRIVDHMITCETKIPQVDLYQAHRLGGRIASYQSVLHHINDVFKTKQNGKS